MYEITIKEIRTDTKTVRPEYAVIGYHLVTQAELDKSAYGSNPQRDKFMEGKEIVTMPDYGYPPSVEKEIESTHEIFTQRVNSLDLAAVIKAINNI